MRPKIQFLRTIVRSKLASGLYLDGALGSPAMVAISAKLSSLSLLP